MAIKQLPLHATGKSNKYTYDISSTNGSLI